MTREERLAAGWTLCWGLYDYADGTWLTTVNHEPPWVKQPKQRRAFESASVASKACVTSNAASQTIPRVFWRQKKPLQFKMGDEVTARGTIASVASDGRGKVRVDFSSADGETGRAWLIPGELTLVRKARK